MDNRVTFEDDRAAGYAPAKPARGYSGVMSSVVSAKNRRERNAVLFTVAVLALALAGAVAWFGGVFRSSSAANPSPELRASLHAMHAVGY